MSHPTHGFSICNWNYPVCERYESAGRVLGRDQREDLDLPPHSYHDYGFSNRLAEDSQEKDPTTSCSKRRLAIM